MKLTRQLKQKIIDAQVEASLAGIARRVLQAGNDLYSAFIDSKYPEMKTLSAGVKESLFYMDSVFYVKHYDDNILAIQLSSTECLPGAMAIGEDYHEFKNFKQIADAYSRYTNLVAEGNRKEEELIDSMESIMATCTTVGALLRKYPPIYEVFEGIEELEEIYEEISNNTKALSGQ